jgi:hypothetical protein
MRPGESQEYPAGSWIINGSAAEGFRGVELPDQMPDGCNFFGLLRTALTPAAVAERFAAAGWTATRSTGEERVEVAWGRLRASGKKSESPGELPA